MLFWIFIAVIIIVGLIFGYLDIIASGVLASFLAVIVFGLTLGLLTTFQYGNSSVSTVSRETLKLKALGNSNATTVSRGYYLGGSYLGTKRVLNYMTDSSGAVRVEAADARTSTVYEDTEASKANVTIYHQVVHNDWLIPWNIGSQDSYDFHIPAGSVAESYTLDNK